MSHFQRAWNVESLAAEQDELREEMDRIFTRIQIKTQYSYQERVINRSVQVFLSTFLLSIVVSGRVKLTGTQRSDHTATSPNLLNLLPISFVVKNLWSE
jgi:hypothetical protein